METTITEVEYETVRKLGRRALGTIIDDGKVIRGIDRAIHRASKVFEDKVNAYRDICMQSVGDIHNEIEPDALKDSIKDGKVLWDHETFSEIRARIAEQDDFIINPYSVEEGVGQCPKCGSKRVFSATVQTRGCDEPATTFSRCAVITCNTDWSYSG